MKAILDYSLNSQQAALWFLGQSGFILKSCGKVIVIDPYLSDSVAKVSPKLTRVYPPPIEPALLKADIFIVTHDHLDHLDPETICPYVYKDSTIFIAPRLACERLKSMGIGSNNIVRIDSGQEQVVKNIKIRGIYAIPNEAAVMDTTGYRIEFENGRSVYHSSDTGFSPLLLECAPAAEVVLVCINGLWGNLDIEEAALLANKVNPKIVIPHHYDVMKLNSRDPEIFKYQMNYINPDINVKIPKLLEPVVWC